MRSLRTTPVNDGQAIVAISPSTPVYTIAESHDPTLIDLLRGAFRRRWWIVGSIVAALAISVSLSYGGGASYTASSQVRLKTPALSTSASDPDRVVTDRVMRNELRRARGDGVLKSTRDAIGDGPELSVYWADAGQSDVLVFTAISDSASGAAAAANAYADAYADWRRQLVENDFAKQVAIAEEELRQAESVADTYSRSDDSLAAELARQRVANQETRLADVTAARDLAGPLDVVEKLTVAEAPSSTAGVPDLRSILIAILGGLIVGIALALFVDSVDRRVYDESTLARASRLRVLSLIPRDRSGDENSPSAEAVSSPESAQADSYRTLFAAIKPLRAARGTRVIQVTSARRSEGKSQVATNLAATSARAGLRALLVDADLRDPQIDELLNLSSKSGLTELLSQSGRPDKALASSSIKGLFVLPAGAPSSKKGELIGGPRLAPILADFGEAFDVVVISTAPVLTASDSMMVASDVDAVILVAEAGSTRSTDIGKAVDVLRKVEAPLFGTVLTRSGRR